MCLGAHQRIADMQARAWALRARGARRVPRQLGHARLPRHVPQRQAAAADQHRLAACGRTPSAVGWHAGGAERARVRPGAAQYTISPAPAPTAYATLATPLHARPKLGRPLRPRAEAAAAAGARRGRAGGVRRPAEPASGPANGQSQAEYAPLIAALRGPGELARRGGEGADVARRGAHHQQQLAGLRSSMVGAVQNSSFCEGARGRGGTAVLAPAALVQASADARARTLAGAAAQHSAVTSPARPLAPASPGAAPPAVLSASRPAPVCKTPQELDRPQRPVVFTAGKECTLHRLSQRTCVKSSQPPRPARNCQEVLPRAEGYVQPLEQARGQHSYPAGHWPGPLAKGPPAPGPADPAGGLLQTGYLASRQ